MLGGVSGGAIREGDWKLIKQGKISSLHNLADERPEEKNYYQDKPDIANALQAKYDAWASRKGMTQEDAMMTYIEAAEDLGA